MDFAVFVCMLVLLFIAPACPQISVTDIRVVVPPNEGLQSM